MRTCVRMIVCALYPRFELLAALGERRALVSEPMALAPEAGREQMVGEVSAPAEAFGVVPGMRLGEAMSRCPALRLVPPDPEGVRSLWHAVLDRLEAIGAAVESDSAGAAFFESGGLHGLHGGDLAGVLAAAGRALGPGARMGAAPCRFAAHAAALQARPRRRRRTFVVEDRHARDFLAPLPVALLRTRRERRGRALRGLAVSARFVAGGTWRTAITLRQASADPERIRLALGPRLADLPAPAEALALEVEAFGPPAQDQSRLLDEAAAVRRARLGEAVRQARQAAGSGAAPKGLGVDPRPRIPQRRAVLAPFPDARP